MIEYYAHLSRYVAKLSHGCGTVKERGRALHMMFIVESLCE
jgi:hypothetical protein